jgi:hypothetical protein
MGAAVSPADSSAASPPLVGPGEGRRVLVALAALALGAALAFALWVQPDFKLFWFVGRHPALAYDFEAVHAPEFARLGAAFGPHDHLPFGYPPTLLLLLGPLGLLPPMAAKMLWSGGWCAAFAWTAWRDTRWVTPLLLLSVPLLWCAAIGQTGLMIATLTVAGFQRLDERPRLAGVLLAVAACMKPQALLLAPIVLWGRWEVVRAAVLAAAAVVLASLLYGPGLWPQWLQSLPRFEALIGHSYLKVGPGDLLPGLWWRVLLDLAGAAFAWRRRDLVGLLAGGLLCAPYVQLYDLAGVSFLGAILVRDARRERPLVVVFGAVLTLCVAAPALTAIYCAGLVAISEWRGRRAGSGAVAEAGAPG